MELVLFRAIPRRDTKPLAKAILAKFGSFAAAISASKERLTEVPGLGPAAVTELKIVHASGLRMLRSELQNRPLINSQTAVVEYCRAATRFETREQTRILFLDKQHRLIADEIQGKGTIDHTPVYVGCHQRDHRRCRKLEIKVHDHIIVGRNGQISLRSAGLI